MSQNKPQTSPKGKDKSQLWNVYYDTRLFYYSRTFAVCYNWVSPKAGSEKLPHGRLFSKYSGNELLWKRGKGRGLGCEEIVQQSLLLEASDTEIDHQDGLSEVKALSPHLATMSLASEMKEDLG